MPPLLRIFTQVPGYQDNAEKVTLKILAGSKRVRMPTLREEDALSRHVVRANPCVGCGRPVFPKRDATSEKVGGDRYVCDACDAEHREKIVETMDTTLTAATETAHKCAETCSKCLHATRVLDVEEIFCENTHCDSYFPRKRAVASLRKAQRTSSSYKM
jgi:hypothetical protein